MLYSSQTAPLMKFIVRHASTPESGLSYHILFLILEISEAPFGSAHFTQLCLALAHALMYFRFDSLTLNFQGLVRCVSRKVSQSLLRKSLTSYSFEKGARAS
jgi:hypothetical protein